MTHQPSPSQFALGASTSPGDTFSARRGQFLDAFAKLEAAISRIIVMNDPQFDARVPFGNKLKALAQLTVSNRLSKKAIERFAALPSEITTLIKIRNDLGHGIMTVVTRNDEPVAAFQNAADYAVDFPQFTLLTVEDFDVARKRLLRIANDIKMLANPPSQRQPSPDTADAP